MRWTDRRPADPRPLPLAADGVTAARCRSVSVTAGAPALRTLDGDAAPALAGGATLEDRQFLLRVDGATTTVLRFDGPATVRPTDPGVRVSFRSPTRVTLGRCAPGTDPFPAVTVPATADGVASAVTHAAAAHRTMGPERSLPGMRRRPPALAVGETHVPDAVAAATPDTGIELLVPDRLPDALAAAPLAYYLGADLAVDRGASPRLCAPAAGLNRALDPLPEVASAMLRRVFFLDCLVRPAAHPGLVQSSLLDDLGLEAPALRASSPAERLAAYLAAPFERVTAALPDWHLATYVAPTTANVRCLPALLDRLSLVYPPESEPLAGRELVTRSLDDFYRGETSRVEVQKPVLGRGDLHGWLAPGTPIDVFDADPAAYEHAVRDRDGSLDVAVVLNDGEMAGEEEAAAAAYRERSVARDASVSVHRDQTRRELADLFATADVVHYVGHCESAGLQCADGHLAVETLDSVGVEAFFLNACGSYHEGRALVERGAVAGAVTFRDVLDEQATTVGATFAGLLVRGFCVERALRLARRQIRMGKDYAVVGDGTHAPVEPAGHPPTVVRVAAAGDGYDVACEGLADRAPGGVFQPPGDCEDRADWLRGCAASVHLDGESLADAIADAGLPVIHDDGLAWSGAFAREL